MDNGSKKDKEQILLRRWENERLTWIILTETRSGESTCGFILAALMDWNLKLD